MSFVEGSGMYPSPETFQFVGLETLFSALFMRCVFEISTSKDRSTGSGGGGGGGPPPPPPPLLATALAILSVSSIRPVHANCSSSELGNITSSFFLNFQDERVYLRVLMPLGNKEREQPMFFSKVS